MDNQLKKQELNDALKNVELSREEAARILGSIGGRSGRGDAKRRPSEMCRQAVAKRWDNYRRRKAQESGNQPTA